MKQFSFYLLLFITLSISSQSKELQFSSDVWPPFTNIEGKAAIAIDIATKALERIKVPSNNSITDFNAVLEGINTGKYDGSLALWKSKEREENLLFSDPYLENQLILVGRKGANIRKTSFTELQHHKIGLVKGYAYEDSLKDIEDLQVVYGASDQENLENLLAEKIDYMLVDALLIQYLFKYEINDVSTMLEIGSQPLIIKPLHLAIRKDTPNASKIISLFNEEIKKMVLDGNMNKLLGLNWIRADINGDGVQEIVLIGNAAGENAPTYTYNLHPSKNLNLDKFYIENKYYDSWEDVPAKYKVSKETFVNSENQKNIGMTLKF